MRDRLVHWLTHSALVAALSSVFGVALAQASAHDVVEVQARQLDIGTGWNILSLPLSAFQFDVGNSAQNFVRYYGNGGGGASLPSRQSSFPRARRSARSACSSTTAMPPRTCTSTCGASRATAVAEAVRPARFRFLPP
jgi:hypothetical protein